MSVVAAPNFPASANHALTSAVTSRVPVSPAFSGTLDLNSLGIPISLPATGKTFSLPETLMEFKFRGGEIIAIKEAHVEGGGLNGILAQLGVDLRSTSL